MSRDLFDALRRGDVAQAARALDSGADPDAVDPGDLGWCPLHEAIEAIDELHAPLALLQLLLDRGATVDARGRDPRAATPLLMAVFREQLACVRLLLAHGANPNVVGAEGDTPIRCAAAEGDGAMVELLLAHGVAGSIDQAGTGEGTTPLGAAARCGRLNMVERLLAAGANPRATDHDGYTAAERARAERAGATGELARRLMCIVELLRAAEQT